jgi:hypothetical protein
MLAELLVEVGDGGKSAFKDNFIYLVVGFAEQVAGFVGPNLVHIVDKSASGTSEKKRLKEWGLIFATAATSFTGMAL